MSGGVYTTNLIKSLGSLTDVDSDNRQDGQAPVYNLSEDIYEHKTVLEPNTTEDIITTGDITCNTLNYTTLNPVIPTNIFLYANYSTQIFPSSGSSTNPNGSLNNWTAQTNLDGFTINNNLISVPQNGYYQINATVTVINGADNMYFSQITMYKNSTQITNSVIQTHPTGGGERERYMEHSFNVIQQLNTSDNINFYFSAFLSVAGDCAILNQNSQFTMVKLRDT